LRKITRQARGLIVLIVWMVIGGFALQAQVASPDWIYSTYLGGSSSDDGNAVAVNSAGSAYVVGITTSPDFPTRLALQPGPAQGSTFPVDGFLSIFDPAGQLFYSTYFATPSVDVLQDVAVGPGGQIYLAGIIINLAEFNAVVARLDLLTQVTYFHFGMGPRSDARGIVTDAQGNVYVTGEVFQRHPVFPVFLPRAYVVKLGSDGSQLYYTGLDGSDYEWGNDLVLAPGGEVWVGGLTQSKDFPTQGAFQAELRGYEDGIVARLDSSGGVAFSTYLGGGDRDEVQALAAAPGGGVWVAGTTRSADFPLVGAVQEARNGTSDLFLAKIDPSGALVASTYLGGSGDDLLGGLAVDASGAVVLAGPISSPDSPLAPSGCAGSFLTRLDPDGLRILSSLCIPGAAVQNIALDPAGHAYLTGSTSGGLTTVNAFQSQPAGSVDAFAAKLRLNQSPDCSAAFASPATAWPPNGRLVPISIRGVTDPDGDPVNLTVTGVRQDEPLSQTGAPDAMGIGTAGVSVRADRDGKGDGRVYRIAFEAGDGQSGVCTGTVTVCVPHDQGRGRACGDGGPLFNSDGR
jgi:hypothetical protein